MRFLVDESTGPAVASWLRREGHEVFSVFESSPGTDDEAILAKAFSENWILVSNDKDFKTLIHHGAQKHRGVVLLRLQDERSEQKIDCLRRLLAEHSHRLQNQFTVVTEKKVRFGKA